MLAWILEYSNMQPGFLIGGIPLNFGLSAKLGATQFFVIVADEYDTAFFDKRSKFLHYKPRTMVLNNLEFDHADIFNDLDAIKTQFHHLIRIIPENGLIISNKSDQNLQSVLEQGSWTPIEYQYNHSSEANQGWCYELIEADGSHFKVMYNLEVIGNVHWELQGMHNISNAISAIAAARHAGVPPKHAIDALHEFKNVKRRMEVRGVVNNIKVYDDFAHHPTAIATTLNGLRIHVGDKKIIVVLEARSNTMKSGIHNNVLPEALQAADHVLLYQGDNGSAKLNEVVATLNKKGKIATLFESVEDVIKYCSSHVSAGDHILIMSNGGFENIHERLLISLKEKF
jgi:UDP-N-acetylmuramate: L-alanyl-gamma-D-glutamyl-meso-diaminopimelate ligase